MHSSKKARAIGFHHVALEVGDIDEELAFNGRLFDFKLRSREATAVFIDLGDQFIALQKGRAQPVDDDRHFGLVVDDKDAVREALTAAASSHCPARFSTFAIRGATALRSSATTTSSSRRRRTYCAVWGSSIWRRTATRSRSSPRKAWHREVMDFRRHRYVYFEGFLTGRGGICAARATRL